MSAAFVGTAGWGIPKSAPEAFSGGEHQLERYARVLGGVEINSSFYRPHAPAVYERWAAMTPAHFRFAVKLPKSITHTQRLAGADNLVDAFLGQVEGLGDKLGPLLAQLPPSLAFDADTVQSFFELMRTRHGGAIVCEPRHASWVSRDADELMREYRIGRVAADPAPFAQAETAGGWTGEDALDRQGEPHEAAAIYLRLHGSPRRYWSAYTDEQLQAWQSRWDRHPHAERWCVFDNTASGAALTDAMAFAQRVGLV